LTHISGSSSAYGNSNQYTPHTNIVSSHIGSLLRVNNDSPSMVRDGRVSTSSPFANSGIMHGSLLSDDSSLHSDSGILNDGVSNGVVNHSRSKPLNNAMHSQCMLAMCTLAKDLSPRIVSLGRRVLSIIEIEQVVAKPLKSNSGVQSGERTTSSLTPLARLAQSSSWFEMSASHLPLTFRTPPVNPPRPNFLVRMGMRRVYSLEFRPHVLNFPETGLADPFLGAGAS
jgi:regulator-associated protein of mTOR